MKTFNTIFNLLLITTMLYLLFSLVNWSFSTLEWTSASKVGFVGFTLTGWGSHLTNENEK